ncbi:D-alanyl-D-alanine carboxypeptidase family protein [Gracilibacillus massiliensis]|uniref:D-alanyl-D-alanine carboxypeptidase family protein n=1 Tax=Gracilibacillus massiliensis TaxID=1564956 RepID=UPI00071DD21C|nr:D-alanyl-D-alanine carboxypeptidase family protein [Gracilibacillus massiliensis]
MHKFIFIILTIILSNVFFIFPINAETNSFPSIQSKGAIIMEKDSGQILFEKNSTSQMYPASLTKIATTIFAIEKGKLEDIVTISSNASSKNVEGTTVFLEQGEKVALHTLIRGLLINSGNDAGVAIAEHLSGSEMQFVKDINTYLKDVIGVHNTNFTNPHGLFNPNHTTTAEDMAKIIQYALKNETFKDVFGAKQFAWEGLSWDTTLITHHKLLKGEIPFEGITGGKNGFVHQSGYTLATTAERERLSLIVITLNSSTDKLAYDDTIELLNFGFDHFETSYIKKEATFSNETDSYILPQKLAFTYPFGSNIQHQVTQEGTLEIVVDNDEILSTHKLEKQKIETNSNNNAIEVNKIPTDNQTSDSETKEQEAKINIKQISIVHLIGTFILVVVGHIYHKTQLPFK